MKKLFKKTMYVLMLVSCVAFAKMQAAKSGFHEETITAIDYTNSMHTVLKALDAHGDIVTVRTEADQILPDNLVFGATGLSIKCKCYNNGSWILGTILGPKK